ncbi:DgyrCDS4431 [Dimorphilus gyrociliatus]|uniref:DgyrCDS4431 n=1 Tax=Dimorphilus gyrociliatus TaxID=2664684 RepID=A0A7I8VJM4_9ANNE|nr:DgyrCDS4431 [Dimorphilus gyrociliatus]
MKNPKVDLCGYSVPHPSEQKINFRIQTKGEEAAVVLREGLQDLSNLCEHALNTFKSKYKEHENKKTENMDVS